MPTPRARLALQACGWAVDEAFLAWREENKDEAKSGVYSEDSANLLSDSTSSVEGEVRQAVPCPALRVYCMPGPWIDR